MKGLSRSIFLFVCTVVLGLALADVAGAAPGDKLWSRRVPIDPALHMSEPHNVRVTVAGTGDVYVAGTLMDPGDENDIFVARYSRAGTRKWVRRFDSGASDLLGDIAADNFGNVVLCGTAFNTANGSVFVTVKYSRAGKRAWVRKLDGPGPMDWGKEVLCDGRGSAYVAGIYGKTAGDSDMCLVKYNADGRRLWRRTYADSDGAYELARGPHGKLYVGGSLYGDVEGGGTVVLCYRPNGVREWATTYGPVNGIAQFTWDLAVRGSGVCVTGQLDDNGSLGGFALRLALDGTFMWQRSVTGGSYGACGIDDAGRVTIAGYYGNAFCQRRWDADARPAGTWMWEGTQSLWARGDGVAVTADGAMYSTGFVTNAGRGKDVWTVGLDANGQPLFTVAYDGLAHGDDAGEDLVLAKGRVYVGGVSGERLLLIAYAR